MEPMVETRHLLWMTGLLEARLKGIVPETKAKMETKIENTILTGMDILKALDQIVMKKVYQIDIFTTNAPWTFICSDGPSKIYISILFNLGDRVPPIGLHGSDPDNLSEVSASAANVTNDGKHPLLEFALRYFRDVQLLMEGASSSEGGGGKKGKKNKKDKKGGGGPDGAGSNEGDWLWKNQLDMVKWTDRMINVRHRMIFL